MACVAMATLVLLLRIGRLHVEVDPDSQLPRDHPYIRALDHLHELFGEKNLVFIGLFPTGGDVYDPAFLKKLASITRRIGDLPGLVQRSYQSLALPKAVDIRSTPDGMSVQPFLDPIPRDPAAAAKLKARVAANPEYLGTLVAADGSAAGILADFEFRAPVVGYPEILDTINRVVDEENDGSFRAHLSGPAIYVAWLSRYSERMFYFFPLALVVIALVHYEAFRTVQAMVLPLLTAMLAMAWSLGLLSWLGVSLDPFNVTTPILILAIAAGHAVQMLKRFYEEASVVPDSRIAVQRTVERLGPVIVAATVIAALSFLSLLTFRTTAIRNFGLFTALGILSTLVVEMTLIPAMRSMLPPPTAREHERQRSHAVFDPLIRTIRAAFRAGGARRILLVAALVCAISAITGSRVVIDSSFGAQFAPGATVRKDDAALNRAFGGTSTLVLLIGGERDGLVDEPRVLRAIERLQAWLGQQPEVGKTLSYVDFVKRMNSAMNGDAPGSYSVPESRNLVSQYLVLYSMTSSVEDFDGLIDPPHRVCAVRVYLKRDSTRFANQMIARLREQIAADVPQDVRVEITGSLASSTAMNEVMVDGKVKNIVQVTAIVLVVGGLALGSFVAGLLVTLPLALSVLTNFGAMGMLGIPLDIGTATISAMAVGIGADYAVYFLSRLREELREGRTLEDAIDVTLATSGKAILFVSSAISAGYLTLCFSGFGYHVRLGSLVSLAMMVSSLASLTVLPAVVLTLRPAFLSPRRDALARPTFRD